MSLTFTPPCLKPRECSLFFSFINTALCYFSSVDEDILQNTLPQQIAFCNKVMFCELDAKAYISSVLSDTKIVMACLA